MIANAPIWPPIMPTRLAALYCSTTKWTLQRAVAAGELQPAGRRGRTMTWRREDLDRWLTGSSRHAIEAAPATAPARRGPSSASTDDALARIQRAARGGAR